MKLRGISFRNFRSIGVSGVVLDPWKKVNILVGRNNAGKSNVIRAMQHIDAVHNRDHKYEMTRVDIHKKTEGTHFEFSLKIELDPKLEWEAILIQYLASEIVTFDFGRQLNDNQPVLLKTSLSNGNPNFLGKVIRHVLQESIGGSSDDLIRFVDQRRNEIFERHFNAALRPIHVIPALREVRDADNYNFSGSNLVRQLRLWQQPDDRDYLELKFKKLQQLMQRLLGIAELEIQVPSDPKPHIRLKNGNLRLELEQYGTGVTELFILCTAILTLENALICIEEPEIHLHPVLQHEFLKFIIEETDNQYLISTHSPTFINSKSRLSYVLADEIQVCHLWTENGETIGQPVINSRDALEALDDLGVRPSDLLQSNCVIWIEGPSDRIYLRRWIELIDPRLQEGQHYSFMIYGGGTLSYFSVEPDEQIDLASSEMIHLLSINQNAIVVMDSDKQDAGYNITSVKRRIAEECQAQGGVSWITEKREIENYLSATVIQAAIRDIRGDDLLIEVKQFEDFSKAISQALQSAGVEPINYKDKKAKYAQVFARNFEREDVTGELEAKIIEITKRIQEWNGLSPAYP
jgi:putative ATP-dependent endonuclease of the OLD family